MPNITDRISGARTETRPGKNGARNRRGRAVGEVVAARKRLDEVYAAYGEPDADFDALADEQAKLEAILFAQGADDFEQQLEIAADALRLPPWDAKIGDAIGRREAPRRTLPAAAF